MQKKHPGKFREGIEKLKEPVLPLVRLVQLLFVTTPVDTIVSLIDELVGPIDIESITYADPKKKLNAYLSFLQQFEMLKRGGSMPFSVVDESRNQVDLLPALEAWVLQQIVTRELETVNSLLCGACNCNLCCIGPDKAMVQEFFEIPLLETEVGLFNIPRIENTLSLQQTPYDDAPLKQKGLPFYYAGGPAIYHWQTGWSMILPRSATCPQLDQRNKSCMIYPQRPDVCRRPQIFSYILERFPEKDKQNEDHRVPAYMLRNSLLAVLDCPYVQELQEEIAQYAAQCQLQIFFKKNKE